MRHKRVWHLLFLEYMKYIVNHKNYEDLPNKFKSNGEILWVSPSDKLRAEWWDKKIKELNCINRAEVARQIHPTELKGLKPCQICGKKLSIFYVYPNKNTLKKLNSISPAFQFSPFKENVDLIVKNLVIVLGDRGLEVIRAIFDIPETVNNDLRGVTLYIKENRKTKLSPGAMSNPPDRLDGFHTYNACCRSIEDTGRHASNLARYTQDRRVYENWAEGNWNLSNRLMGEFIVYDSEVICPSCGNLRKMTADHIGPISLGFTHRPRFNPLCSACNSKKNNRMSYEDVQRLIEDEKNGDEVVSWHSKYIWNRLKNKINSQQDAIKLSKLMRANLHHVLILFSKISESGFDRYLGKYLHPEYSFVDYKFLDFHPMSGPKEILEKSLDSKNKEKNAKRYLRIAFESIEEYKSIENRNTKIWSSSLIDNQVTELIKLLTDGKEKNATILLHETLKRLASEAEAIFDANSSQSL